MSCDFKVGDEVVCIRSEHGREGMIFTVAAVKNPGDEVAIGPWRGHKDGAAIQLHEMPWAEEVEFEGYRTVVLIWGYDASCFRKVQRRDLGEWLKTDVGNTDHIDRSVRERVGA